MNTATDMPIESFNGLQLLRVAFPPNQISKLPKPSKAQTEEVKNDYRKGIRCQICQSWHHPQAVHLDYVGHAALTDRLLDADPMWSWEPLSMADGLPVMDGYGGMWIRLTVCGVSRLGYGHAGEKSGGDAIKEVIGDALRNAAMRFGAALDLWHKGDLHAEGDNTGKSATEILLEQSIAAEKAKRMSALDERALDMIETYRADEHGKTVKLWFDPEFFKSPDEKEYVWGLLRAEPTLRALLQANDPNRDHKPKPEVVRMSPGPGLKKVGIPTNPAP